MALETNGKAAEESRKSSYTVPKPDSPAPAQDNILGGSPSQIASLGDNTSSATASDAVQGLSDVRLPTLLAMAAVAWQTRRAPTKSRHENRYTSGTFIQYLNQNFVDKIFAGVLKVDVLNVDWNGASLDESAGIKVRFKDREAIAGYHSEHDGGKGTAYLWLRKGEQNDPSTELTFHHVEAGSRKELAENPEIKIISATSLTIDDTIPKTPEDRYNLVLRSGTGINAKGGVSLQVAVSFVPLKAPTPAARLSEPQASMENSLLRQSISLSAQTFTIDDPELQQAFNLGPQQFSVAEDQDPEDVDLEFLPALDESRPRDSLFKCALTLGLLFDGGFWRHGRGAEPIAYINNKATETELLVFWNEDLKEIAVAFDSTRASQTADIITDLRFTPAIFAEGEKQDQDRFRRFLRIFRWSFGRDQQLVHNGFLAAWRSVQYATESVMKQAMGIDDTDGSFTASDFQTSPWKTSFIGHSLGGALATLAAASSAAQGREQQQLALYTFGSPRVGNAMFLKAIYDKVPERVRVYNRHDMVSGIPRSTGFDATPGGLCFLPSTRDDGTPYVKLSLADEGRKVCVVPGKPVPDLVQQACSGTYPHINTLWDRITYEAGLVYQIATFNGFLAHSTPRYLASLLNITKDLCTNTVVASLSPATQKELADGLAEAQRLLELHADPEEGEEAEAAAKI